MSRLAAGEIRKWSHIDRAELVIVPMLSEESTLNFSLNCLSHPVGRNVSLLGAVVDDFMALTESFLDGISRQSSWVSVVYNQLIDLHILYLLGYHPGKQSSTFDMIPFVDHDHFIHQYFLPLEYAIFIPVFAGVTLLSLLSLFVGSVMLKSKKKKA
ncbi:Dolichol-phosphate mannose synthase subunit 2 [Linum perenne]